MNITSAMENLREIFNSHLPKEGRDIPAITPATVFEYYTTISRYSTTCGMMCTPISRTIFRDVETYTYFLKFLLNLPLLQSSERQSGSTTTFGALASHYQKFKSHVTFDSTDFPCSPYSHYLLLSADGSLQKFDENSKIFNSEFFYMFPKDRNLFLHPALRELKINPTYFVCECDKEKNADKAISQILQILQNTLPIEMSSEFVINQASAIIDKQLLFRYWELFSKDGVFKSYILHVIKNIALLLTKDDRLFSTSSEILPMYFPPMESSDSLKQVVKVFNKLELPFLDESVVSLDVNCPHLKEDADRVLSNIMQVGANLASRLNNTEINILIDYFAENLNVGQCFNELKTIPFFEDVLGRYQSIKCCDAYVWPNSCSTGYQYWMEGYNIIFLKRNGYWTRLGSAQQLSLKTISEEELYNKFIFRHPHFGLMSEGDRYSHLEYIRDELFYSVECNRERKTNRRTSAEEQSRIYEAQLFHNSLVQLYCTGATNKSLLPISSFCDHTKEIFCAFPDDFKILPQALLSTKWLDFFKKLNLKETLTETEYLNYCHKTANGGVQDVRKASQVLLEYLELEGSSYCDNAL